MSSDAYMLFPEWDQDRKWMLYLGIGEVVRVALFLLLVLHAAPRLKPMFGGGAVWYTVQAYQQFFETNEGSNQQWEYWLVGLMAVAMFLHLHLTRK